MAADGITCKDVPNQEQPPVVKPPDKIAYVGAHTNGRGNIFAHFCDGAYGYINFGSYGYIYPNVFYADGYGDCGYFYVGDKGYIELGENVKIDVPVTRPGQDWKLTPELSATIRDIMNRVRLEFERSKKPAQ